MAILLPFSPMPVLGADYYVVFPIFDNDGDLVSGAAGLDSEICNDADLVSFADCVHEATEIASSGLYYLRISGSEMCQDLIVVQVKTSTVNAKTTPIVINPLRLVAIRSGTLQDATVNQATLDTNADARDDYYRGLFILITNNSPVGVQYTLRQITGYVGSTKVAQIYPDWHDTPNATSTYTILVPPATYPGNASGIINANLVQCGGATVPAGAIPNAAAAATGGIPVCDAAGAVKVSSGTGANQIYSVSGAVSVGSLAAAALNADMDTYQAKVWLVDDNTGSTDRYVVVWFKNSQPVITGITLPTIQVVKVADGADLIGATAMTQIAATGMYRYDEASARIVNGVGYIAKVTATIGGSVRTWYQPVSRDT